MANILIVDDTYVLRNNLKNILQSGGHKIVGEAFDGKMAVNLFVSLQPDIVTMDITMPGMNGIEATKLILEKDSNAKIVMVSANSQRPMVLNALRAGAANYIIKPFYSENILKVIDKIDLELKLEKNKAMQNEEQEVEKIPLFEVENQSGSFMFSPSDEGQDLVKTVQSMLIIRPLHIVINISSLDEIIPGLYIDLVKVIQFIESAKGRIEINISLEKIDQYSVFDSYETVKKYVR